MQFCQRHWDMMRAAVEARGMTPLVASNGAYAMANLISEVKEGPKLDNFDPLMAMHWNISINLMEKLGKGGLYLLTNYPEDPIDTSGFSENLKRKYDGKTWPRCPICYCNISHEISCRETRCALKRENGWDICIEMSADTVKEQFEELMRGK